MMMSTSPSEPAFVLELQVEFKCGFKLNSAAPAVSEPGLLLWRNFALRFMILAVSLSRR